MMKKLFLFLLFITQIGFSAVAMNIALPAMQLRSLSGIPQMLIKR